MKTYIVHCAECGVNYEQESEFFPHCCGNCGDSWIAVKVKTAQVEECQRCGGSLDENGYCNCPVCDFSGHKQSCPAGWCGHPEYPDNKYNDCTCGDFLKEDHYCGVCNSLEIEFSNGIHHFECGAETDASGLTRVACPHA